MEEMPTLPNDMLGYDRAITVFSPDGRLLQVEYARKTVAKGATAIGMATKDGVVFVSLKVLPSKLIVPESVEKIFQVDEHVGAAVSGIISDGRVLIKKSQEVARKHHLLYDEPVDILTLVKDLCEHMQLHTQYGGVRPYGVSLLIGGIDDSQPKIFVTEPIGTFFEYKAVAIGENSQIVNKQLEKDYKPTMSVNEAVQLGINALKKVEGQKFDIMNLEIAVVDEKGFKKLSKEDISRHLKAKKET